MVNLTRLLMMPRPKYDRVPWRPRATGNDGYWRKRQILKISSHFYGRSRNCFTLAIRRVQKALMYATKGRAIRKELMKEVWEQRIDAGCQELGHMPQGSNTMLEALARCNVSLNRQSLSNLAIWEPRTFEAIDKIAAVKAREEKIARYLGPFPKGILGKL